MRGDSLLDELMAGIAALPADFFSKKEGLREQTREAVDTAKVITLDEARSRRLKQRADDAR